jgi:hypothetical protein
MAPMEKMRRKFKVGDRVRANPKAPGDYVGREGVVAEQGPGRAEYGVRFDDGPTPDPEYLYSWWLDRVA